MANQLFYRYHEGHEVKEYPNGMGWIHRTCLDCPSGDSWWRTIDPDGRIITGSARAKRDALPNE